MISYFQLIIGVLSSAPGLPSLVLNKTAFIGIVVRKGQPLRAESPLLYGFVSNACAGKNGFLNLDVQHFLPRIGGAPSSEVVVPLALEAEFDASLIAYESIKGFLSQTGDFVKIGVGTGG